MGLLFLLWMCYAAVYDFQYRRCENWLIVTGLFLALISVSIFNDRNPVHIGLAESFLGFIAAFFVLLVFYLKKMMGAGDVKFAAILGIWVGFKLLLPIWVLSCVFAVLHGVVVRSNLKYFFAPAVRWRDGSEEKGGRFIPYVTYLSTATVIVLMLSK